jgi:hypothetical protein
LHGPCRLAQDIGGHIPQLDVGIFEDLLEPIDHARPIFDQTGAMPRECAQFALLDGWDEAGGEQAMLHQVGDPLRIAHIGLAPRHGLDVRRIDQQQGKVALEEVKNRSPIHASHDVAN